MFEKNQNFWLYWFQTIEMLIVLQEEFVSVEEKLFVSRDGCSSIQECREIVFVCFL